jgi:hypothetical protein
MPGLGPGIHAFLSYNAQGDSSLLFSDLTHQDAL